MQKTKMTISLALTLAAIMLSTQESFATKGVEQSGEQKIKFSFAAGQAITVWTKGNALLGMSFDFRLGMQPTTKAIDVLYSKARILASEICSERTAGELVHVDVTADTGLALAKAGTMLTDIEKISPVLEKIFSILVGKTVIADGKTNHFDKIERHVKNLHVSASEAA